MDATILAEYGSGRDENAGAKPAGMLRNVRS